MDKGSRRKRAQAGFVADWEGKGNRGRGRGGGSSTERCGRATDFWIDTSFCGNVRGEERGAPGSRRPTAVPASQK